MQITKKTKHGFGFPNVLHQNKPIFWFHFFPKNILKYPHMSIKQQAWRLSPMLWVQGQRRTRAKLPHLQGHGWELNSWSHPPGTTTPQSESVGGSKEEYWHSTDAGVVPRQMDPKFVANFTLAVNTENKNLLNLKESMLWNIWYPPVPALNYTCLN